ncbi:hypothetical protein BU583_01385 [Staphylococcus agnetis]|uniref:hypothetical protein n=1 Tax=Staphylococcus agnetis TaxID=985762 RepID=UPI000D1AB61D|nr:hypothetical protein [Staphylococcus agnetis]PTH63895.1 hypothetical protein BU583_01100 [Staphylococcus agnetis]PTH63949.1 hypothetical protein BU583_01385 [Staphylococcus agnetis]
MEIEKVVYNVHNGQPFLVVKNEEGENVYPEFEYTEVPVPEGVYLPAFFDVYKNQWIGSTKEEFEKTLTKETSVNKDLLISQLTIKVATQESEITQLKSLIGNLTLEVAQLKGGAMG